ncbi:MAG: DUF4369 domain-containing protein [Bacteroidales bacterium]|nr:DUF4369 domain-containing protein [Candidatus Physcousia equi]
MKTLCFRCSVLVATLLCLLLAACGTRKGQLRIRGQYENIKQGEFLLISTDGGLNRVDTLHVRGGEFDYETELDHDATFCIIYPNHAQLVLWAHSGDYIKITGDAQDLWHVKVKGNDENELYTQFRQRCALSDTLQLRSAAAAFIREHPSSPVANHLLCQYFVQTDGVPRDSTMALYGAIHEALPNDAQVAMLGGLIHQRYALVAGEPVPDFDVLDTDSVHHTLKHYAGKRLVLYFWAGWQGNGSALHRELSALRDKAATSATTPVELLGYSLDYDSLTYSIHKPSAERNIPTCCDLQGFSSLLPAQWGVRHVPYFVVVGPTGKIEFLSRDLSSITTSVERLMKH